MNPIFSIGIESLWDEVSHMPTGGVWWMNTDRHEDAVSLLNQTLSAQADEAKVAVVREGANKQVISSQADSLIKISRIWADFFPANTS
ncbi:BcsE family c-di-GMP-binding protein, partial [Kluyvera cryocrescens]|uniref:BcsE family c-di-GMP-binding protein n=1 Tax=Kluyvera cryocrescens TaxID=580 RepID=UPI0039F4F8A2